jgi:hypothetical protein
MSSHPKKVHGPKAYFAVMVVALLVGLLGGVGGGLLQFAPEPTATWLTAGLLSLGMMVTLAAILWYWRGIDEAAREAHKWAWWWGGTGGMTVGAIVLLTMQLRELDLPAFGPSAFASGMMAILLLQVTGYALAWAFWWLRNR